jgi:hypothetical protein
LGGPTASRLDWAPGRTWGSAAATMIVKTNPRARKDQEREESRIGVPSMRHRGAG